MSDTLRSSRRDRKSAEARIDDLDAVEMVDEVDLETATPYVVASAFDDPETVDVEDVEDVDQAPDVESATQGADFEESIKRAFGAKTGKNDIVAVWLNIATKHPIVSDAQFEEWFRIARGDDPDAATRAEDLIVRHNVRLIWDAVRRAAGAGFSHASMEVREELLGQGNLGFVEALRKYDPSKLIDEKKWSAKSVLGYAYPRIAKRVKESFAREQSGGLSQGQYLLYGRVQKALAAVMADHKRDDSLDAELSGSSRSGTSERKPLTDLADAVVEKLRNDALHAAREAGIESPGASELRDFGAVTPAIVKFLLDYQTQRMSLNQGGADDEGPDLEETIGATDGDVDADLMDEDTLNAMHRALFSTSPVQIERKHLMLFAASNGVLGAAGRTRYPELFAEELGELAGRTSDSVMKYEAQARRGLAGDAGEDMDSVRRPRVPLTVAQAKSRLANGSIDEATLRKLRRSLSMRELVEAAGVTFADADTDVADCCPFEQSAPAGSFSVEDDERFACTSCGRAGDVFSWIAHKENPARTGPLSKDELDNAIIGAIIRANAIPSNIVFRENGRDQVLVTKYPKRKEAMRRNF